MIICVNLDVFKTQVYNFVQSEQADESHCNNSMYKKTATRRTPRIFVLHSRGTALHCASTFGRVIGIQSSNNVARQSTGAHCKAVA